MQKISVLTILLLLISVATVQASWEPIVGEISYQINNSDRIIAGNVIDIRAYPEYTVVTIEVDEWLMGPLPSEEIEVITERGTTYVLEGEPKFYVNESMILMLQDINVTENSFKVTIGEPGKHPVSARDEIVSELESMVESDIKTPFIGNHGLVLIFASVGFMLRRSRN